MWQDSECVEWRGYRDRDGYGRGWFSGGQMRLAHQAAYVEAHGAVPPGLILDHLCRNRACVNPDHLEPVTRPENTRRGIRAQKTHCDAGHPFDDTNTYRRKGARGRTCRKCQRETVRRYRVRRSA